MLADEVARVLVVGAGTMAQQIALQCAMHGFAVVMLDSDAEALTRARAQLTGLGAALAGDPAFAGVDVVQAVGTITYENDPAKAASDVDIVSESVPEDPSLKGAVFAELDRWCPERTVFATNTSSLLPSMYAEASGRPDRLAALHFHQPVWSANLVDVMPHPSTSDETIEILLGFAARIGQIPIRLQKESPGYVFNAMYNALNREAITLATNGVATVEDIDLAWTTVMKTPRGPVGMLDYVGIDTAWHITQYWATVTGDPQLLANAAWLKSYVDQGRTGVKTGMGFYDYSPDRD